MVYERNTWINARYVLDWTTQRVHGVALRWYIRTYVLVNCHPEQGGEVVGVAVVECINIVWR